MDVEALAEAILPKLRRRSQTRGEDGRDKAPDRSFQREPFSVLYLNCEIFSSFRDLLQALRWYLDFKGRKGVRKSYIFLDEVGDLEVPPRAGRGSLDVDHAG